MEQRVQLHCCTLPWTKYNYQSHCLWRFVSLFSILLHSLHFLTSLFPDMGCGEIDGSYREQLYNPSINTTDRMMEELYRTDFVMHIGDMSYAQGYAAIVSTPFIFSFYAWFRCYCLSSFYSGMYSLTSWGTLVLQNPTWCASETTRETRQTLCESQKTYGGMWS